jgi:hypothetical protein
MTRDEYHHSAGFRIRVHAVSIFSGRREAWLKTGDGCIFEAHTREAAQAKCDELNKREREQKSIYSTIDIGYEVRES